ncbi:sugar ABC transporter ATP-binding protein [Loktanella sp. D2R18]|uniref:ABC transporter ATP-binding protein n=1 Tax=Rhodobacterales TaxID=204455 RepID=UPI000DEB2631|nr:MULTISPECIES: sn-glycerol-3-phosphate ABC transporter ATP-binding protein UgpC [Rhodobacterales]MDO6591175.1 sn-glycerol-3-phosphate ABC transporter ATP-binding protein UgpC [Yoonia sp. 1_MG-2023]RBW41439.1 sugar ABC transporter ATP-binding protein [Loktanella sp. D2R18]
MTKLVLNNVKKSYGDVDVIHGIDMEIQSGEFCVFVGPSGCGKSTLLRVISGLEDISAGDIEIDETVVNQVPAAQRGLAMVFQSYALYPHMSVRKNLSFGLENLKTSKAEIEKRVTEAARMLQIDPYLDRRPGQLSGGQRQRVAIGRAVVREPKVFLFDEPLSNLDAELRVSMRREIGALHRRLGNTMIYVTHDQVEAMTMADKIAVLRAGKVEQFGTPLDLFNHPKNRFVAGFIGSPAMNFLQGKVGPQGIILDDKTEIAVDPARLHGPEGTPVELGVRPRDLIIDPTGPINLSILEVEQLGAESYLFAELSTGESIVVHQPGQTDVKIGDGLRAAVNSDALFVFDKASGQAWY